MFLLLELTLMNDGYYNTVPEIGDTLKGCESKAKTQDGIILKIFNEANKPLSPDQVEKLLPDGNKMILTSVRRSISNLTRWGYLQKTGVLVMGSLGRNVNTWKIQDLSEQLELDLFK